MRLVCGSIGEKQAPHRLRRFMTSCSQGDIVTGKRAAAGRGIMAFWFGRASERQVEVREHNFVGEERRPFKGGGAVSVSAAD